MIRLKALVKKLTSKRIPQASQDDSVQRGPNIKFHEAIQEVSLHQMNISLYVLTPQSNLFQDDEPFIAPLSRLLEEGTDPTMAHNYSFETFKEIFEDKINDRIIEGMDGDSIGQPHYSINMNYGALHWVRGNGDILPIVDEDDFAVALNGLYLSRRKHHDDLNFMYQTEFEEQRRLRLEAENHEKKDVDKRTSSVPPPLRKQGIGEENWPAISPPSQIPPYIAKHRKAGSFDSYPGLSAAHNLAPAPAPTPPAVSNAVKAREAVKTVLSGVGFKGPETKAEERVRFQSMYEEKSRASYKRGGNDKEISVEEIRHMSAVDHEIAEGEADDLDQDAEEEETDVENADRIVAKLQELTKLEELSQLNAPGEVPGSLGRWKDCCAMFRCDPNKTGIEHKLKIAGLHTQIYQYQALGVYWQMITARQLGGGFLADDMGLGKTLSFLAYIVVERQLTVLERIVIKSRLAKDGKHLTEGQNGVCPTAPAEGWIICPCSSSSPTSKMRPQPGLRMACVPAPVVKQWWNQWKLHVDTTDAVLGMKLAIDHPAVFLDNSLLAVEMHLRADAAQNRLRMEAKKAIKDGKKNDEPKDNHDGILLLTTQEGFPKLVKKCFETEGYTHDPKNADQWVKNSKQKRCSLIFGIAMIDECHEEYFKNTGRAKILTDLPRHNNKVRPFLFGYSGTPFSQTPRGIEGVLWAIEKHSATVDESVSWRRLDGICKQFDAQLKSEVLDMAVVDSCLAAFKVFLTKFMIRRTGDTMWFGHALVQMKPHIHTDVVLKSEESFAEDIRDFEKQFDHEREELLKAFQAKWEATPPNLRRSNIRPTKLGFNVMVRAHWRSRLLATFPYLHMLALPDSKDPLNLSLEEALGFLKANPKDTNPYKRNLRAIFENSPKCLWLYNFINDLKTKRDVEGREHKLVIMTSLPQVAYLLNLIILKYFPEYKELLGLVAGRMKPSDKVKIINAFTDNVDDNASKKNKKEVRILIGLTRSVGVGLQLQKACHAVLMEPDYEFVNELQAYGRVHRIGQKNPFSRSFRLIGDGNDIEKRILKRQEDRKENAGTMINEQEVKETEKRLEVSVVQRAK